MFLKLWKYNFVTLKDSFENVSKRHRDMQACAD